MSLRLLGTKTALQQKPLTVFKLQASRFGTISLTNSISHSHTLASETTSRPTFQIPIWLEPFLWAAPKKKTSHSKKRMRASNKGLKQKENIAACPACGNNKLLHHLCGNCYNDIKKRAKSRLTLDA